MKFDPDALLHWRLPPGRQAYKARDIILYALGTGLGADPHAARDAVLERPILHGLCTFAIAGRAGLVAP